MRFILTTLIVIFLAFTATAQSPIFEFECFGNANMTGDSCDICVGTSFQSRSFNGLMVYRLGVFNRWIDEPYLIRLRPGNSVEFIEQTGTNPDRITIPLNQTGFSTISGFIDSTFCAGANVDFSFFASDSLRTTAINYLDTIKIVGRGGTTVFFDTLTQKYIITSPSASGGTNLSFTGSSSPVTLNSSTGTDVNFVAGTSISLAATGTDLTITNTAPNINQTISTTGAAGNITLSNGGGTLNLNVNDADASATNEIQTLSLSGANLSLSLGGGTVAIPQGTITGTLANNNIPKGNGTSALQTSLSYDDGTTVGIGNSGTNLSSGRLEISKSYTNPTDGNVVLTGNIPLLTYRGTRRFAIGTGYSASDNLSFLGTTVNNSNPTTELGRFNGNGDFTLFGSLFTAENMAARFGSTGHAFGATSAPSGVSFFVNSSGGERVRLNGLAGAQYFDFFNPASGSNRNYTFAQNYFATGDFSLLQSSTAGGTPTTNIFSVSQSTGNLGIGINSAAAKLDINGDLKVLTRTGTATTVAGFGSDNISRDIVLGTGLSITSGTLNASGTVGGTGTAGKVAYFSGASTLTSATNFAFDGTNLAVGTPTAGGGRLRVVGNSTSVGLQVDAGTLPDFGATVQMRSDNASQTIYGIDAEGNTGGSSNYLNKFYNTGTGSSVIQIGASSSSTGDAVVQYNITGGGNTWSEGIDNSDADKFKIQPTAAIGSISAGLTITTGGLFGINNTSPGASIDMDATTDGIALSSGNTANRPASGLRWLRYNSNMAGLETRTASSNWHVLNSSNSVTLGAGAALGTAPTITVNNGSEMAYTVSLTVGTAPTANAVIFTRTFPNTWSVAPTVVFSAANQVTASEITKFYVDTQTTGQYTIRVNGTLSTPQTYKLNIILRN